MATKSISLQSSFFRPISLEHKQSEKTSHFDYITKIFDKILPRNPVTHRREIHILPESFEIALGKALYPSMIAAQGGTYDKKNYTQLVNQVGQKIAACSDRNKLPYEFSVIDSKVLNAWCLPGGKIAFYRGLIEKMDKEKSDLGVGQFTLEEKIAAVMGHEITHAAARHSAKTMEFGAFLTLVLRGMQIALLIFSFKNERDADKNPQDPDAPKKRTMAQMARVINFVFDRVYGLVFSLIVSHSGRNKEFEADKYGMVYLQRAGYRPETAIWLQEFFAKQQPKSDGWISKAISLFSTHPSSEERANTNRKTLEEIKKGILK